MMMHTRIKKRRSNVTTVCLLFLLFVVVHHFTLSPFPRLKIEAGIKSSKLRTTLDQPQPFLSSSSLKSPEAGKIICDRTDKFYDLCSIDGPTVMDPTASTFYLMDSPGRTPSTPSMVEKIRPYPRKWEITAMRKIKELTLTSGQKWPPCKTGHSVPALVFSLGGSVGNLFFEFNEGFVPLFITVNYIFPEDQDFVFVISKACDRWVDKYSDLLQAFSKHPIIYLDNDNSTHCFPSANFGLVSHGFMSIDPTLLPKPKTFIDFHNFLVTAYSHDQNHSPKLNPLKIRPRLVLMSREGSVGRVLLNEVDVKQMAEEIGFDVSVLRPARKTRLREDYALISSSHAMVGVHGSALTQSLFLRSGSVFLQVVPLGNEAVAELYYGNPAKAIGLDYMEYKIGVEESTLINKYDKGSLMIKDPVAYIGKNWSYDLLNIYWKEQDVRIDLVRFRECLVRVYTNAKRFMEKEG